MKRILGMAVAGIAAVASTAFAQSGMSAGKWEYSVKTEIPGMPMQIPPQVFTQCLTQQDIEKGEQYRGQDDENNHCELKNLKQSGDTASYDIACKDGTRGHYEFSSSGNSMTGKGQIQSQGMSMTTHFTAKRLGDCK